MQRSARGAAPDATNIEPFWTRLREISLYPAQAGSLTTIVALALCRLVVYVPFGWALNLLVWVALYKYAIECLRATANGRMESPEISTNVEDSAGWNMIWLQVIFFLFNLAGFLLLGPWGGMLVALLLAFALPGAMMSVAMDGSLSHAVNPLTWLAIIGRLRSAYFSVVLLIFVFTMSQGNAVSLLLPFMPEFLAMVVYYLIAHYVVIATFHLMGYLIWQYHDVLGYEPEIRQKLTRPDDPDAVLLEEIQQQVREGEPERAADQLAVHLRQRGGTPAVHAQYRKLLVLTGRRDESLRHGLEWINILLAQDDERRALEVSRECIALDPAFRPPADAINRLAERAAKSGQSQLALGLLSGFHRKHPKHRDLPANLLLASKLLVDRMGRDAEARKMLDHLLANYAEHPLRAEILAYRQFLDSLPGKPAPLSS
jgi:hypothetical protein